MAIQESAGARRLLDCFAVARPEGRASLDALWVAMTIAVGPLSCRWFVSERNCKLLCKAEYRI